MILVTGGSRGIGRAIVMSALSSGHEVVAVARNQLGLDELLESSKELDGTLKVFATDLSTKIGCQELGDFIRQQTYFSITLVNNAAVFDTNQLASGEDTFESLLQLNLLAAHRLTRLLFDRLQMLVNIGSVGALDFPAHMAAYAASKYALHGWHHALVKECVDLPIRFLLIIPGATLTSSWDGVEDIPPNILQPIQIANAFMDAFDGGKKTEIIEIRPV